MPKLAKSKIITLLVEKAEELLDDYWSVSPSKTNPLLDKAWGIGRTICVMSNDYGDLSYGISTWKSPHSVSESSVLKSVYGASNVFDPKNKRFGTACAEVNVLYYTYSRRDKAKGMTYSYAIDIRSGKKKQACNNCKTMLKKNFITDIAPEV